MDGKDVNEGIGNEVRGMKFKGGVVLTEMKAVMPLMALIPCRLGGSSAVHVPQLHSLVDY